MLSVWWINDLYGRLYPDRENVLRPAYLKAHGILSALLRGDIVFDLIRPYEAARCLSDIISQFEELFPYERQSIRKETLKGALQIAQKFLAESEKFGFSSEEIALLQENVKDVQMKLLVN